ncbi:DEAD/DEAH box helicase [Hymenobacter canadensis]|uniref:DEAD/DEAH box helicase family protein n=1 Tax=Hymenobacter canadensis TaxID=2999067 RepID=A0ABY7LR99_9BACT|nr:DEAD/DEAH box helicase family protein [Hymenobacter canadensis]WBA42947.1 DEAD/DEAH box helicase family protein [Hymenobacter canadensis]
MVDFRKRTAASGEKKTNPIEIYDSLDTMVGVTGLRPAQESILQDWFDKYREQRDIIVKLHTGQGKTLVGLLMLQSQINAGKGPAIYLCPDPYLSRQTQEQAKKFGIKYSILDTSGVFPSEFLEGKRILITTVKHMFNGRTKFKLGTRSMPIGTIVLDDSHACIDKIQETFTIKISKRESESIYETFIALFEDELKEQGQSRFNNVREGDSRTVMLIPYWAWQEKQELVDKILRDNTAINSIGFAWQLLINDLKDCQCYISGTSIEISPYHNTIEQFGSFHKAGMRIFMSATTNNDAFFIKSLGVPREVVQNPLMFAGEKWSGEKMILDPYQISDILHRGSIINMYAPASAGRKYGIVSLVHSHRSASHWQEKGALVVQEVEVETDKLRAGDYVQTRVLVNRYDGIDLPDDACRILILDSLPFAQSLGDTYQEYCRPTSTTIDTRVAQKIEQGLGRGVRGEKDYCVIIITGPDLINMMRTPRFRENFSAQTRKQIEIGIAVNAMVSEEATSGDPIVQLNGVIKQCLGRDEGWKDYYHEEMDTLTIGIPDSPLFHILELERKAAEAYKQGDSPKAQKLIKDLINSHILRSDPEEVGWYMQEMARYAYAEQRGDSNIYQTSAYKSNQALLKPKDSTYFKKLEFNQTQIENAKDWLMTFASYDDCRIAVDAILNALEFGKDTDKFETGLKDLGTLLGFSSDQPDKQWKIGPDNLWNVAQGEYIFFECKNGVKSSRTEISKREAGQTGQHKLWFKKMYHDALLLPIIITPATELANNAILELDVRLMDQTLLRKLKKNVRDYLKEFKLHTLKSLTSDIVREALSSHSLTKDVFKNNYTANPITKSSLKSPK